MTRRRVGAARLSALMTAAMVSGFAAPAIAATNPPAITAVPDGGSRPVPNGTLQLPAIAAPTQSTATGVDALLAQRSAAESDVELLGEQLNGLNGRRTQTQTDLVFADYALQAAQQRLADAQQALADSASSAYAGSGGVPDLGFGALNPRNDQPVPNTAGAANEVARAAAEIAAAKVTYDRAVLAAQDAQSRFATLQVTYNQRNAALIELIKRYADKQAELDAAQEAQEQALGHQYLDNSSVDGLQANPLALKAVQFALRQLGKSYVWGAEGPNHFDCSGLTWAAYHSAGVDLPRVSTDQYQGTLTNEVSRYSLLPGDLLFFATDVNNAATIHHVAIYLGNGKMVHSPTTGDVVKISTVWWSHFYAATRVVRAVPIPGTTPSPTPTTPSPTPTTPSPTPTTPSPTPTAPSPTPTTPSPSPTPTDSSPTPSTEPTTLSPSATDSPSSTATPSA